MILLGLGSNLGDREQNLQQALKILVTDRRISIEEVSSVYETAPFGVTDQADFLNMVARIKTDLSPQALLLMCLAVEAAMGRIRTRHWGPRIIDIDLLIYDDIQIQSDVLTLPHPGIVHRAFVLIPMQDVAGGELVLAGTSVEAMVAGLPAADRQGVRFWKKVKWDSAKKCFV